MNSIELTKRVAVPIDSEAPACKTKLSESAKFDEWDINSLVDFIIKQYHFNTRKNVVVIYDLAQQVFSKHNEKHPELAKLVEALFLFFDDLLCHLKKEEQILFPNIIQLTEKKLHEGSFNYSTFGVIKEYVLTMQNEHGRFDGVAIRTPVPVVSISDITFVAARNISVGEINRILMEESKTNRYKLVLSVVDEPLVSSDIIQSSFASVVDIEMTRVVDGDLVKIMAWYDNEWGFTNQMMRQINEI